MDKTEYMRDYRTRLRAQGLCEMCGRAPAREGYRKCAACLDQQNEAAQLRYIRLKAAGICVQCGRAPAREGSMRCAACLDKQNEKAQLRYIRLKAAGSRGTTLRDACAARCASNKAKNARKKVQAKAEREMAIDIPTMDDVRNNDRMLTEQQRCYTCKIPMEYCTGKFRKCYRLYVDAIKKGEAAWVR